jgi:hypothetical protein
MAINIATPIQNSVTLLNTLTELPDKNSMIKASTKHLILSLLLLLPVSVFGVQEQLIEQLNEVQKINNTDQNAHCQSQNNFDAYEYPSFAPPKPDSCTSGVELGLSKNRRKTFWSHAKGGAVTGTYTQLDSPSYYRKQINGQVKEVTDNIFYNELLKKYPTLAHPKKRLDGISIKEEIPKIDGINYQMDEWDEPQTPKRSWTFDFFGHHGNNRLLVTDNPLKVSRNSKGEIISSQEQDSPKLMRTFEFFPRKTTPSYKLIPDKKNATEIHVTLPNGEVVIYDAKTGALKGGAFKSRPRKKSEYDKGRYLYNPNEFEYSGGGVWIESVESEKKGYSRRELTKDKKTNYVYVKKNNPYRECKVPSKDLWVTKSGTRSTKEDYIKFEKAKGKANPSEYGHLNTGYTCFHFKYQSDADFNAYLQKKCGFGF